MRGSGVSEEHFPHTRVKLFLDMAVSAGRGRVRQGEAGQGEVFNLARVRAKIVSLTLGSGYLDVAVLARLGEARHSRFGLGKDFNARLGCG